MAQFGPKKRFCLVLIRASRYDDDGYVIRWMRSVIPSNSLAVLHGLAADCADRQVLGADTELEIHSFDETNTRIVPERIAALVNAAGAGLVMLVGVQSNQFPRALDIAAPLRRLGLPVVIGGFHVSGTISMLKERDPDVQRALDLGISLFAGEAEGRFDEVLADARDGRLQPLYNYLATLPDLSEAPLPLLPSARVRRTAGSFTSFDAGRGCPFQCSFCTIINVQGRRSRRRSSDDVERIVRANAAQGIHRFFITDDNFARNQDWEAILDRLIHLREVERVPMALTIQVDVQCHRLPNFIAKAARAGVNRVFIGLESVSPENLVDANKRQNNTAEYRRMLLGWKQVGVATYCGYILGFPKDTPESINRDIAHIQRDLPVDILEFFSLTPLPGSADHRDLHVAGVPMDPDMNQYDGTHVVCAHPRMSREEWQRIYQQAWLSYYSDEHVATLLRRAIATGCSSGELLILAMWFRGCMAIEGLHPLECGILRLKAPGERRPGLPVEPAWRHYPRELWQTGSKALRWLALYLRLQRIHRRVRRDPHRLEYLDAALEPVTSAPREAGMAQAAG
jgi:hypothetical protein